MLNFISIPLQELLTFFYNLTATIGMANYGVAIILMTVLIKMLLYPLTVKQVKSMKGMQDIQPKLKEIQEKYKGNPEKLNKEVASLYKQSGINPLSGCLPLVIQMPILISIFYAIRDFQYLQQPNFLWVPDLAKPDHLYILPVLSAFTTFIQQKQTTTDTTSQQNKMMMIFMPLFIGYISLNFPAGLVLYWVISNVIQIAQQWYMYRKPVQAQGEAQ